jgi:hypothetical protein
VSKSAKRELRHARQGAWGHGESEEALFRIIFLVNPEGGRARRQAGTKKAKRVGLVESNIAPKRAELASWAA